MDSSTIYYLLAGLLMLAGLAGTIVPALPGLPLLFGGVLLAAWAGNFALIGTPTLIAVGLLALFGLAIDFLAGLLGAKYSGASRQALWGSLLGAILGIFFGLPGLIFGPLLGAALGEWLARRDLYQAGKVGLGTFIGFIVGTVAKLGCALAMLACVVIALLV